MKQFTIHEAAKVLRGRPAHDDLVCGLAWDLTCVPCLMAWNSHPRQAEIPLSFQNALGFNVVAEKTQETVSWQGGDDNEEWALIEAQAGEYANRR